MKLRLLGFDPGRKRIGVATANMATGTSQPLEAVDAFEGVPNWQKIDQLIAVWQPDKLIVGLPLRLDGSESEMTAAARDFAEMIQQRSSLEVLMVDERLTSNEADALIRQSMSSGKAITRRLEQHRDSLAAQLILNTYMNDNPTPP